MPVRAQALTMHYFATDADGPKTGDVGNHTLKVVEDGVVGSVAGTPSEVDATNAPGIYKVAITAAENTADVVTLCGKSSTSGVTISPSTWTNIANVTAVNGSADVPAVQEQGSLVMQLGECAAGCSTTAVKCEDGTLSSTDDIYNGRTLVFTTGSMKGEGYSITDYNGSGKTFTVSTCRITPSDGDKFILLHKVS